MAGHHSRRSRSSHHSSHGESHGHGSYEHSLLNEEKLKDQALDVRIKMVKKALVAAKGFAKDLQALGLSKEDAVEEALEMLNIKTEHHGGGH